MSDLASRQSYFLSHEDPSVRLLALREAAGFSEAAAEVRRAKAEIARQPAVQALMADMHPEGFWMQKDSRTGAELGAGVEYGAYASTHYVLSYLAELGMDRSDPRIERACERYLSLQSADGDFWRHMSCLLGINLRTFEKLGYRDDGRVRASLDLLLRTARPDAGYLCDMHEKPERGVSGRPLKRPKSCYRGSAKVLFALVRFPEMRSEPRFAALIEYFLSREGIFRNYEPAEYVVRHVAEPSFPFTWSADVVQVLYALSTLGCGADPRLERAWHVLGTLRDEAGFIPLASVPSRSTWKPERRGRPSVWITLYADIALLRKERKD